MAKKIFPLLFALLISGCGKGNDARLVGVFLDTTTPPPTISFQFTADTFRVFFTASDSTIDSGTYRTEDESKIFTTATNPTYTYTFSDGNTLVLTATASGNARTLVRQ